MPSHRTVKVRTQRYSRKKLLLSVNIPPGSEIQSPGRPGALWNPPDRPAGLGETGAPIRYMGFLACRIKPVRTTRLFPIGHESTPDPLRPGAGYLPAPGGAG